MQHKSVRQFLIITSSKEFNLENPKNFVPLNFNPVSKLFKKGKICYKNNICTLSYRVSGLKCNMYHVSALSLREYFIRERYLNK